MGVYRTYEGLPQERLSDRQRSEKGCKGKALAGGRGGVPHNKVPPSPGQEKGARGMRSSRPWFDPDRLESAPSRPSEVPNGDSAGPVHGHG